METMQYLKNCSLFFMLQTRRLQSPGATDKYIKVVAVNGVNHVYRGVEVQIYSFLTFYSKTNQMHQFISFIYFGITLYIFFFYPTSTVYTCQHDRLICCHNIDRIYTDVHIKPYKQFQLSTKELHENGPCVNRNISECVM